MLGGRQREAHDGHGHFVRGAGREWAGGRGAGEGREPSAVRAEHELVCGEEGEFAWGGWGDGCGCDGEDVRWADAPVRDGFGEQDLQFMWQL